MGIRKQTFFLFMLLIASGWSLTPQSAYAIEESGLKKALFIRPDVDNAFWNLQEKVMRAAAHDLDVKLDVIRIEDDQLKLVQIARSLGNTKEKPDIVFTELSSDLGDMVLQAFEEEKIDVFVINSSFAPDSKYPLPRKEYKHWIGEMTPDDTRTGTELADYLYEYSKKRIVGTVNFLAIDGRAQVRPNEERVAGLNKLLKENSGYIKFVSMGSGHWDKATSEKTATRLLSANPKASVIWAINDESAIGAVKAAETLGRKPGEDIFIGGIDWLPEVFALIREGKIAASYGGHFAEGAWALILAYDYKNGHDFAPETGVQLHSAMQRIDHENVNVYGKKLETINWNDIDFKEYTKTHNPNMKHYDFNVLTLLD